MKGDLPAYVGSLLADVLSSFGVPGANTAGVALQKLMERRLRAAADILIEELKAGSKTIDAADIDDTASMLFRYMRAAQEGAARLNLRLMANVIAGQRAQRTLTADEFLYHAEVLASLRREEVIVLGAFYRHWLAGKGELDSVKRNSMALQDAKKELIPSVLKSEEELAATMAAITRTGLLVPLSAFGGIAYHVSPLLERLSALASFEAALQKA